MSPVAFTPPACRNQVPAVLSPLETTASEQLRMGHFEQEALLLDPAALAWGLRLAAQRRGVRIFGQTPRSTWPIRAAGPRCARPAEPSARTGH